MLPHGALEAILAPYPPELGDIAREIRSIVAQEAPGATETFRKNYFNYYFAERGGPVSAGICQVGLYPDHIRLAFIHGAFLPDPAGLLQGNRLAKRWIDLHAYDEIPWEAVRALIAAHAQFDPRSNSY
jgi:hypothetical protein